MKLYECPECGNTWPRDKYEREMLAWFPTKGLLVDSAGYCPSCGTDTGVDYAEESEQDRLDDLGKALGRDGACVEDET